MQSKNLVEYGAVIVAKIEELEAAMLAATTDQERVRIDYQLSVLKKMLGQVTFDAWKAAA